MHLQPFKHDGENKIIKLTKSLLVTLVIYVWPHIFIYIAKNIFPGQTACDLPLLYSMIHCSVSDVNMFDVLEHLPPTSHFHLFLSLFPLQGFIVFASHELSRLHALLVYLVLIGQWIIMCYWICTLTETSIKNAALYLQLQTTSKAFLDKIFLKVLPQAYILIDS